MAKKKPDPTPDSQATPTETPEATATKDPKPARMRRPAPPTLDDLPKAQAPRTRYESFNTQLVDRDQIKEARYNPRYIDPDAKGRLEDSLKGGMLQPIVWNKRTGTLVGGHQRLSVLDQLHGQKPFSVTCAVVDADEATEKLWNVRLNSQDMAGQFDYVRLEDLMRERRTDDAMADLSRDFGISEATLEVNGVAPDLYLPPEDNEQVREILEDGEETQALKDVKKEHKKKDRLKRDKEALRQVAFILPDKDWLVEARGALMEKLGYPADFGDVFLDGYKLLQALGISTPEDRDDDEE